MQNQTQEPPEVTISQARHDAVWQELNQLRNFRNYVRGAYQGAYTGLILRAESTMMLIEELEMFEKRTHEAEKRYYEKESGPTKPNPILNPRAATIRPNVEPGMPKCPPPAERQMVTTVPYEVYQAVLKELDDSRKWIDHFHSQLVESRIDFKQPPERNVTIQRMAGTYDATMRRHA